MERKEGIAPPESTSLVELLEKAGFVDVRVLETGRHNGDCLEAEIEATRPNQREA